MFKKKNVIKISGELDMSVAPNEVRIMPSTGDPWIDFGYWLEATSFMAKQAMEFQGWNADKMREYVADYLDNAIEDYEVKS